MTATEYPCHKEASAFIPAPPGAVFAHIDQHARLAAHMSSGSWMMGGGTMTVEFDATCGKGRGARIRLAGKAFGFKLAVDEEVVEYAPPLRKAWETIGIPQLVVIGPYRMGFAIEPRAEGSRLTVFIDYMLPERSAGHWLGRLFAAGYAGWCTRQMARDTLAHFASAKSATAWNT
jgi:hypothetical protein